MLVAVAVVAALALAARLLNKVTPVSWKLQCANLAKVMIPYFQVT